MKVAAIVLAAGRSTRFGEANKLLAEIGGKPMVARAAALALASRARPVIVVTGFEAERVATALKDLGVEIAHNPDFAQGIGTSLRAGLRAVPRASDGALILLGDMPRVDASVLDALLAAFAANGAESICVPVHAGRRGNPVLWARAYFPEMMRLSGDRGAKQLMRLHPGKIVEVEVGTDSIFKDIDLAADLDRGSRRA
jgi:molybdenum cofactor cytidylyltransferase